jgi:hypothetical protein
VINLYEPEIEERPTKIMKTTETTEQSKEGMSFKESVYVSKGLLATNSGKFNRQFDKYWSDANKKEIDVVEDSAPIFK